MRLGWEIFNPLNAINPDETTRFPFAAYVPAGGAGASMASYANGRFKKDEMDDVDD